MNTCTRYALTASIAFAAGALGAQFGNKQTQAGRAGEITFEVGESMPAPIVRAPTHLHDLPPKAAADEMAKSAGNWTSSLRACYELSGRQRKIDQCLSDVRHALSKTDRGLDMSSREAKIVVETAEKFIAQAKPDADPTVRAMRELLSPWLE